MNPDHITFDDCHPRDTDDLAEGGPHGVPVLIRDDDGQAGLAPVTHTQGPQERGQERAVTPQSQPARPQHRVLVTRGIDSNIPVHVVQGMVSAIYCFNFHHIWICVLVQNVSLIMQFNIRTF